MQIISLQDSKTYEEGGQAPRPIWVDCSRDELQDLVILFGLKEEEIRECLSPDIHPRVQEFGDHLFMVANICTGNRVSELNIFLGKDFLISIHTQAIPALAPPTGERYSPNPALLLHWILDRAVDSFYAPLESIASQLEDLEEIILSSPSREKLGRLFELRRSLLRLRRSIVGQEQMLRQSVSLEALTGDKRLRSLFADVHNHAVRTAERVNSIRDLLSLATETYLTAAANRTGEVTRLLASVATIFLPLTLIAGIYGMNFDHLPGMNTSWGHYAVIFTMISIGAITYFFFRKREWI